MYSNRVIEIFKSPTNAGGLQGANGTGKYTDEACGDCVKIYLKVNEDKFVTDARFKTIGSVGSIVASSVVCSLAIDDTIENAKNISVQDVIDFVGEFGEDKEFSIEFAIKALNLAIEDYYVKLEKAEKNPPKKVEKKAKEVKVKVEEQLAEETVEEPVIEEVHEKDMQEKVSVLDSEIDDEELPKLPTDEEVEEILEKVQEVKEVKLDNGPKKVSSARAMFDAMFEE